MNKSKEESKDARERNSAKGVVKKNPIIFKQKVKWQLRVKEVIRGANTSTSGMPEKEKSQEATDFQASVPNKAVDPEKNFNGRSSIDKLVETIPLTGNKFSALMEDSQMNHLEESEEEVEDVFEEKIDPKNLKNVEKKIERP